jgi:hypothetical protein
MHYAQDNTTVERLEKGKKCKDILVFALHLIPESKQSSFSFLFAFCFFLAFSVNVSIRPE